MKVSKNLKLAKNIAKSKGGKCLTKDDLPKSKKYKWQCEKKHVWETSLANIAGNNSKIGTWCPYCKGVRVETSWIDRIQKVAKEFGGKCLSKECSNQKQMVQVQCKKGHIWSARAGNLALGHWCIVCSGHQKHDIKKFKDLAFARGGKCISNNYSNQKQKLEFICSEGHRWNALPTNIIKGSWCPDCSGNTRLSLDHLQKLANHRGGKILSKKYIKASTKYKWSCGHGHIWDATYVAIYSGSWCPSCSELLGERLTRFYFEKIFKMKFKKVHPTWLRDKVGDPWELDGLGTKKVQGYSIAFEHHGVQHYRFVSMFHRKLADFKNQVKKDEIRRNKCKENKVLLFEIPELLKLTKLEDLPKIIKEQLLRFGLDDSEFKFNRKIDFSPVYKSDNLDEFREIIKEKKGEFFGRTLVKRKLFLDVGCNKGHRWQVDPSSIKNGTWCPYCAGKNVEEGWFNHYKQVAIKKGGDCLSKESDYVDARSNLKWRCAEGHEWKATPSSIKGRTWCPICGIKKRSNSQRDSIENMRILAQKKNGKCLSKIYVNTNTKLEWQCENKHKWKAVPSSIKNGSWCPECYKNQRKK